MPAPQESDLQWMVAHAPFLKEVEIALYQTFNEVGPAFTMLRENTCAEIARGRYEVAEELIEAMELEMMEPEDLINGKHDPVHEARLQGVLWDVCLALPEGKMKEEYRRIARELSFSIEEAAVRPSPTIPPPPNMKITP